MNIGIFTDTYYPQINGVATSIRMLERELAKLGHSVYVFTTTDPNARQTENVFRLPSMPLAFLPSNRVAILYSPKLLYKVRFLRLDVIHTHSEFPMGIFGKLVSEIYRIPMVHTYHTMYEDYTHYLLKGYLITAGMARSFSRVFCNRAKVVIAPVDKTKTYLKDIGVSRHIKTIPTGLDFSPFASENFTKLELERTKLELGIEKDDPVIIYVGRVAKEKSLDMLIEMMPNMLQLMPDAKLVIVGDGPHMDALKQMSEYYDVQRSVVFAGARPWDALGKYYQLGDVFVTASTSETQGLTCLEAMAAKVPVFVKKGSSFEGLVKQGETGFLFENKQDAADMIYYVMTHKEEAERVTECGFKAIQALSARQYALNVEKVYRLLNERV